MSEDAMLELGGIIFLGIGAQWLAWRLKLPSILFLLIFGILAGPVTGFIHPDEIFGEFLLPFVSMAVAIILFEGGLSLRIKDLKKIGHVILALITIGVLITSAIITAACYYILHFNLEISLLIGAILVVTGPTVVGPLLNYIKPTGRVREILKWEGIIIDPIGALFAVLVFEVIITGGLQNAGAVMVKGILGTIIFGGLTGFMFSRLLVIFIKRLWIPEYLHETMTLTLVIAAFIISNYLQPESGLFAATLMGILLDNQNIVAIKHIVEFKENLRVLIISVLFIILSARLPAENLQLFHWSSFVFLAIVIFIARPVAVFLSTLGSGLKLKEKTFISWMAPRGIVAAAVSSVFAIRLSQTGIPNTQYIVPIVFFVIIGTVVFYGLTSAPLARLLGIAKEKPEGLLIVGAHNWARIIARSFKELGYRVLLVDTNKGFIQQATSEGFETYYGNAVSKQILDNIELNNIGRILALTSNNEANALALLNFSEIFEKNELYQLCPESFNEKNENMPQTHLRGRFIFAEGLTYTSLSNQFYIGSIPKLIRINDDFNLKEYLTHTDVNVIPLYLVKEDKQIQLFTSDKSPEPKSGDILIVLAEPKEES